jgi:hypothetical protein
LNLDARSESFKLVSVFTFKEFLKSKDGQQKIARATAAGVSKSVNSSRASLAAPHSIARTRYYLPYFSSVRFYPLLGKIL